MNSNSNKWMSRKFIAMVVGFIFTIVSTAGYQMPVDQVSMVDAILVAYMLIEGIIDAVHKKPGAE